MHLRRARLPLGALAVAVAVVVMPTHAAAEPVDTIVADSDGHGTVLATGSNVADAPRTGPIAVASVPRGIVVTQHRGRPVAIFAAGQPPLRKSRPGSAPATFTGLRPGVAYTVVVGGEFVGKVLAVDRPAPATRLVVHAAAPVGTVELTWQYKDLAATGGTAVEFTLRATSATATTVTSRVSRLRSATLTGLSPSAIYSFSITPASSAGSGRSTVARMSKTLAEISAASAPTVPAPSPSPTATPTPTPSPAPAPPATHTVYVCPQDYVENSQNTCTRTLPYTYHQVPAGPAPLLVSYETTAAACPSGYNYEDYGWVAYCRLYGPVPMTSVKDPTPAGYTDNGTAWVRTVPKDAVIVPG